jgi:hypothetical protein
MRRRQPAVHVQEKLMRSKILLFTTVLILSIAAACGSSETNVSVANVKPTNANTEPSANADNPLGTVSKPEAETTNNAPTLAPVINRYYEGLKKRDDSMVRSTMTQEFQKRVEEDMRDEKRTDFAAMLAEFDTIPDKPLEVRNERIEGNRGSAEVRGGAYLNWTSFEFENEGGTWKLTGRSQDIRSVDQSK